MPERFIDLRSDTVTRPTPGMRAAIQAAEVGDDVFGEDPTVNRLQERVAALLGKEAALYVPSGTMSNQICIKTHTQPGDELLCEARCHIYNFEAGGPAVLSGVTCRTIEGDHGILELSQLEDKIRAQNDHLVRTRIATGIAAAFWARHFDSVSVCFSKGLGAPIGSALAGTKEFITKARRVRKLFGGGMRQAGMAAAAALYALEHHIDRLAEDHRHAQVLAQAVADTPGLRLDPPEVETNIVFIEVERDFATAREVAATLKQHGILVQVVAAQTLRACLHLDVTAAQAEQAAETSRRSLASLMPVR